VADYTDDRHLDDRLADWWDTTTWDEVLDGWERVGSGSCGCPTYRSPEDDDRSTLIAHEAGCARPGTDELHPSAYVWSDHAPDDLLAMTARWGRALSAFAVFTALHHEGDFHAACDAVGIPYDGVAVGVPYDAAAAVTDEDMTLTPTTPETETHDMTTTPAHEPTTDHEKALAHLYRAPGPARLVAAFIRAGVTLRQDDDGAVRGYIVDHNGRPGEPVLVDNADGTGMRAVRDFNLIEPPHDHDRMGQVTLHPVAEGTVLTALDAYAVGQHTDAAGAVAYVLDGTLDAQVKRDAEQAARRESARRDSARRSAARRSAARRTPEPTTPDQKLDAVLKAVTGGGGGRKTETQDEVNERLMKDRNGRKHVAKVAAAEAYGDVEPVRLLTGAEAVTPDEDEDETYLIPGMWSYNRPQLLVFGDPKVGKSTFCHNVIAALLSGDRLFGSRRVARPVRNVMLIDTEMSASYLRHEFAEQWPELVDNSDRFILGAFGEKGAARQFNVSDPDIQNEWVEKLKAAQVDVLIVDCLGPLLRKAGIDENTDAGAFMEHIRTTCERAGVRAHMILDHSSAKGSANGKITPRGDSKKLDTADTFMHLGEHPEKVPGALRLTVTGRDGNAVIDLERDGYRLSEVVYSEPKEYKRELDAYHLYEAVSNVLTKAGEPMSQTRLVAAVTSGTDYGRPAVQDALKVLVAQGHLAVDGGGTSGKAKNYSLTDTEPVEPALPPKRKRDGSQGGSAMPGNGPAFGSLNGLTDAPDTPEE
jgi:hypothetical protein